MDPRNIEPLDLTSTADAGAIKGNPTSPEALLGTILAGLSKAAANAGASDPMAFVTALARDFEDGFFNGAAPNATTGASEEIEVTAGRRLSPTAATTDLQKGCQAKQDFTTGSSPVSVALADMNGDGKLDVVTSNQNDDTVSVLLGNGNGSATEPRPEFPVLNMQFHVLIGIDVQTAA